MKTTTWKPIAVFIALSLAAGFLGTIFTTPSIPTWYASLVHPSWTPPNWLFAPVWTTLYILMGVAAGLVWKSTRPGSRTAIYLFLAHLAVNAFWSIAFFGLHRLTLAMGVIALLWVSIVVLMVLFWRHSRLATYLMIPYLVWVTYASSLNLGILFLNS